jgi:hypothetical protein
MMTSALPMSVTGGVSDSEQVRLLVPYLCLWLAGWRDGWVLVCATTGPNVRMPVIGWW